MFEDVPVSPCLILSSNGGASPFKKTVEWLILECLLWGVNIRMSMRKFVEILGDFCEAWLALRDLDLVGRVLMK
jgi:hypothetical protein